MSLHEAIYLQNNIEVIKELVANGANVNKRDVYGKAPIHYAVSIPNGLEVIKTLVSLKANINIKDYKDYSFTLCNLYL